MDVAINGQRLSVLRDAEARRQTRTLRQTLLGRPNRGNTRIDRAVADTRAALADQATMTHVPRRPWWTCRECQAPWPCPPGKKALGADMSPTALCMYMAVQMGEAIKDMPTAAPGALWDRFLAWTREYRQPL